MSGSSNPIGMYACPEHALLEHDSDVYDCVWHVWWVRSALDSASDPRVYYNISLAWHNMGWPDLFFSYITGTGYNGMLLFGSAVSAIAGYLLARSWGTGRNGSMLAALIIVWMPVRVIRMYQHYPIASIGYVLLTMYFVRKHILYRGWRNLTFLLVFSVLAVAESLYHGLTIAAGWLITTVLTGREHASKALKTGIVTAAGCVIGSLWLFSAPGAMGENPGKDWREAVFWAAEPQSFLLPSFLGKPVVTDYMPNPFEGVVSPGMTVGLLALVYCFMKRSWKGGLAVLAVIVLSMGPLFKMNGVPTPVPLPYMVLAKMPWLSAARAPSRMAILAGIMAACAAGAFVEKRKAGTGWILTGLILLEITPLPLRTIEATVPGFYYETAQNGIVLEIPSSDRIRRYTLFETVDGSRRIVKFLARGGEVQMEDIPASLAWGSTVEPVSADIFLTGAETVVYNRWMFSDSVRCYYDSLYINLFPEEGMQDSVWVWTAH